MADRAKLENPSLYTFRASYYYIRPKSDEQSYREDARSSTTRRGFLEDFCSDLFTPLIAPSASKQSRHLRAGDWRTSTEEALKSSRSSFRDAQREIGAPASGARHTWIARGVGEPSAGAFPRRAKPGRPRRHTAMPRFR